MASIWAPVWSDIWADIWGGSAPTPDPTPTQIQSGGGNTFGIAFKIPKFLTDALKPAETAPVSRPVEEDEALLFAVL